MTLKASSILESVIAIAIISICIVIASSIYVKLINADYNLAYYQGLQHIERLNTNIIEQQNFEDDLIRTEAYTINKTVIESENNTIEIEYHLKTRHKEKKIYHLIQKDFVE